MALLQMVLAAAWLIGLWAAAALFGGESRAADRLRDMLILGTVIPLALGFLHLLYAPLCWIVLAGCVAAAAIRAKRPPKHRSHLRPEPHFNEPVPYLTLAALAMIASAPPIRAHLQGWGAPQLFAGGLAIASTPLAFGWSGLGALALLGLRLFTWAREGTALPTRLADALAAAFVSIFSVALFARPLQADVWIAAFFVEVLWSAPVDDVTVLRSAAACALVTPLGWLYAAIALAASQARPRAWIAAGAALALWVLHDLLLLRDAFTARWGNAIAHAFRTNAFVHPAAALHFGFAGAVRFAPFGLLLVAVALASPWLAREAPLRFAGIGAVIAALVVQSAFDPAMAAGAIVLAPLILRNAHLALVLLLVTLGGEALHVLISYRTGSAVVLALFVAIATPVAIAYMRRFMTRRASPQPN